ncbi:MAG: hypothetical protein A2293_12695 [Elusimicrobia bacterium RIFOXYB2_FULL_49_7]|nr:MAG: hypothetical protein A2293_12695 [Elusimicrobia bacterium RIFOXYB2_FULL_49_7]
MFDAEIITPEKRVFKDKISQLVALGKTGGFAVLTGHAPLFSMLKDGFLRVDLTDGKARTFDVHGGMLEVDGNRLILLADKVSEETLPA